MARVKKVESSNKPAKMRPALTPEAREGQLVSLAVDLAEQQLRDGTASSQETTHFLKLASTKAKIEKEILLEQKKLIAAKTESLESTKELKGLYSEALNAMRMYSGKGDDDD